MRAEVWELCTCATSVSCPRHAYCQLPASESRMFSEISTWATYTELLLCLNREIIIMNKLKISALLCLEHPQGPLIGEVQANKSHFPEITSDWDKNHEPSYFHCP